MPCKGGEGGRGKGEGRVQERGREGEGERDGSKQGEIKNTRMRVKEENGAVNIANLPGSHGHSQPYGDH